MMVRKRFFAILLALCMVLTLLPGTALAAETSNNLIQIVPTNITADSVVNYEGYGSLVIDGEWEDDNDSENYTPAQLALINRNGSFLFSYQDDPVGNGYTGNANFRYSDGIVSLTLGNCYYNGDIPEYYDLGGNKAFSMETTDKKYTYENGTEYHERTSWIGGPMRDGYAVVIQKLYSGWSSIGSSSEGGPGDNRTLIIDKTGTITCELPSEYNQDTGWGASGFGTEKSLGWCGEGLFAFYDHTTDDDCSYTTEVLGYMDPTGRTVIDLTGKGYIDAWPFHEGLAAVKNQSEKKGFIDKNGALVIPCSYDDLKSFNDGLCPVEKNDSWGYIDKSGKVVIPFEYDDAYGAGDGLASVVKDGKCGLVDYENKVVVPLEYDDISSYEDGVAYGIKNGQVYLMTDYSPEPPDDGQLHGKVSVSAVYNAEGEQVTLTVTPDPGYKLSSIEVTEDGGNRRVSLSGSGNTYTFRMPPYDVTVEAKFTKH